MAWSSFVVLSLTVCCLAVYAKYPPIICRGDGYGDFCLHIADYEGPYPRLRCSQGFRLVENVCYQINEGEKNWAQARQDCDARGGSLADIPSLSINKAFTGYLTPGVNYWIGLNDIHSEAKFTWESGFVSSVTNWGTLPNKQPDSPDTRRWGKQDCVAINYEDTGKWNDRKCHRSFSWICSRVPTEHCPPGYTPAGGICEPNRGTDDKKYECPRHFSVVDDQCYQVNNGLRTWREAQHDCDGKDADLAYFPNAKTNRHVTPKLTPGVNYWIGLNDIQHEATFRWTNGQRFQFTNWGTLPNQQPDSPDIRRWGDQDCVAINYEDKGEWNDRKCHRRFSWICSQPAKLVSV